jgi:anti-anti-sigma factor
MAACAQTDASDLLPIGLQIVVSHQKAQTTIALDGEWGLAEQDRMRHAIWNVLKLQPDQVMLDLSRVTFMDSTGIHDVRGLASRAARLKIEFVVILGPRPLRRLFELCQLSQSVTWVEAA